MKSYRSTTMSTNGMVTTPHYLASQAAVTSLQKGGNAVDAAITAASVLSVVYPHMNGLGGDNFWLIYNAKEKKLKGLNASGRAGEQATIELYKQKGFDTIPPRGYEAANTVPGAVSGWSEAYRYAQQQFGYGLKWEELFEDSIGYAQDGFPVTPSQEHWTNVNIDEKNPKFRHLQRFNGFRKIFLKEDGTAYKAGEILKQMDLSFTLKLIAKYGADSFYKGEIADKIVEDLRKHNGLLTKDDFLNHRAEWVEPLSVNYRGLKAANLPPNTQGIASLSILNILDHIDFSRVKEGSEDYIHYIVEATKRAFEDRDRWVTDPDYLEAPVDHLLSVDYGSQLAREITERNELNDLQPLNPKGDTVWFGVVDAEGNAVSIIQSIYHDYGSGIIPNGTGVLLQNRGSYFSLNPDHIHSLSPNKRPFHTLNPAMLLKNDKPHLIYGTMGGEGQPQTQAAIVTRIIDYNFSVQAAIEAPRWLYGRTWGEDSNTLKIENRVKEEVINNLKAKGHEIEVVSSFTDVMGHAGAIWIDPENNVKHGGADPRSDGAAIGY